VLILNGGTLTLTGKSGAIDSQTFASTTVCSNRSSTITLNQNSATSLTLGMGAITRNTGSLVNFKQCAHYQHHHCHNGRIPTPTEFWARGPRAVPERPGST